MINQELQQIIKDLYDSGKHGLERDRAEFRAYAKLLSIINTHLKEVIGEDDKQVIEQNEFEEDYCSNCDYMLDGETNCICEFNNVLRKEQRKRAGL